MAYENKYDIKWLLLMFISLPLTSSTNIDCSGKSFHCLNVTHFMICVDVGGGVSTTVDDFVIPCPSPTVCISTNRFECEFPPTTTVTDPPTTTPYSTPWWSEDPASIISSTTEIVFYGNETDAKVTSTANKISTDGTSETAAELTEQVINLTKSDVIVNETQIFGDYLTPPIQEQHLEISSVNPNTYTTTDVSIIVTKYSTSRDNAIPYVTESYTENLTIDLSKDLEETTTNDKQIIDNNPSTITTQQNTLYITTESNQSFKLNTTLSVNEILTANPNEVSTSEKPVQSHIEKATESIKQKTVTDIDNNRYTNDYTTSLPQQKIEVITNKLTKNATTELPKIVSKKMFVDGQSLFTPGLQVTSTIGPVVEIVETTKKDTTQAPILEVTTETITKEAENVNATIDMQLSSAAKYNETTLALNQHPAQFGTTDNNIIDKNTKTLDTQLNNEKTEQKAETFASTQDTTATDAPVTAIRILNYQPIKEESIYIQNVLTAMKNFQEKPVTDEPVRFYNLTGTGKSISFTDLADSGAEKTHAAIPVLATPQKVNTATLFIHENSGKEKNVTNNRLDPLLEIESVTQPVRFETSTDINSFQLVSEAQGEINLPVIIPGKHLELSTVIVLQDGTTNPSAIKNDNQIRNVDQNVPFINLSENAFGVPTDQSATEENLEVIHSNILTDDFVDLVNVVSNGVKKFPDQELRKLTAVLSKVDVNSNATNINQNLEYTTATTDATMEPFLALAPIDKSKVRSIANDAVVVESLNLSDFSSISDKVYNSHTRTININELFDHETNAIGTKVSVSSSSRLKGSETTTATIVSPTTRLNLDSLSMTLENIVKNDSKMAEINSTRNMNDFTNERNGVENLASETFGPTDITGYVINETKGIGVTTPLVSELVKESNNRVLAEISTSSNKLYYTTDSTLFDSGSSVSPTIISNVGGNTYNKVNGNETDRLDGSAITIPMNQTDVQVTAFPLDNTSLVVTPQSNIIEIIKPENSTVHSTLNNTITGAVTVGFISNGSPAVKNLDHIHTVEENIGQQATPANKTEDHPAMSTEINDKSNSIQLVESPLYLSIFPTTQKSVVESNVRNHALKTSINNNDHSVKNPIAKTTTVPMLLDFNNTTSTGVDILEKTFPHSTNKTWSTKDSLLKGLNADNVLIDTVQGNSNHSNKEESKLTDKNIQAPVPINTLSSRVFVNNSIPLAEKSPTEDFFFFFTQTTLPTPELIPLKEGNSGFTESKNSNHSNKKTLNTPSILNLDFDYNDTIDIRNTAFLWESTKSTFNQKSTVNTSKAKSPVQKNVKRDSRIIDAIDTIIQNNSVLYIASTTGNPGDINDNFSTTLREHNFSDVSSLVENVFNVSSTLQSTSEYVDKTLDVFNNNSMSVEVHVNKEPLVSSKSTVSGAENSGIEPYNFQDVNNLVESAIKDFSSYQNVNNHIYEILENTLESTLSADLNKNYSLPVPQEYGNVNNGTVNDEAYGSGLKKNYVSKSKPSLNGTISKTRNKNLTNAADQLQANQSSFNLVPVIRIVASNVTPTAKSMNVTNESISESKPSINITISQARNENLTNAAHQLQANQSSFNLVSDPLIGIIASNVTPTANSTNVTNESISESKPSINITISQARNENLTHAAHQLQANQSSFNLVSEPVIGIIVSNVTPTANSTNITNESISESKLSINTTISITRNQNLTIADHEAQVNQSSLNSVSDSVIGIIASNVTPAAKSMNVTNESISKSKSSINTTISKTRNQNLKNADHEAQVNQSSLNLVSDSVIGIIASNVTPTGKSMNVTNESISKSKSSMNTTISKTRNQNLTKADQEAQVNQTSLNLVSDSVIGIIASNVTPTAKSMNVTNESISKSKSSINTTISITRNQNLTNADHEIQVNQSSLNLVSDSVIGIIASNFTPTAKSMNVTNESVSESNPSIYTTISKTRNQNLTNAAQEAQVNQSSLNLVSGSVIGIIASSVTPTTKSLADMNLYTTTESAKENSTHKTIHTGKNDTRNNINATDENTSKSKITNVVSETDHQNFTKPELQVNKSTVFVSDSTVGVVPLNVTPTTMAMTEIEIKTTTDSLKKTSTHKTGKNFTNNMRPNGLSLVVALASSTESMDRIPSKLINQFESEKRLTVNNSQITKENSIYKIIYPKKNSTNDTRVNNESVIAILGVNTESTNIITPRETNKFEPVINSQLTDGMEISTEAIVTIPPKEIYEFESAKSSMIGIGAPNVSHEAKSVANVHSYNLATNNSSAYKQNHSDKAINLVNINTNGTIFINTIASNETNQYESVKTTTGNNFETFKETSTNIILASGQSIPDGTRVNNTATSASGVNTESFVIMIPKETNQNDSAKSLFKIDSYIFKENSTYTIVGSRKNNTSDMVVNNKNLKGILEVSTESTNTTTSKDTNQLLSTKTLKDNNSEIIKENIMYKTVDLGSSNIKGTTVNNTPVIGALRVNAETSYIIAPKETNKFETAERLILNLIQNNSNDTIVNTTSLTNTYDDEITTNKDDTKTFSNRDLVTTATIPEISNYVYENKAITNGDKISSTNQEILLSKINKEQTLTHTYENETTRNRDVTKVKIALTASSTESSSTHVYKQETIMETDQTPGTLDKEPVSSTFNKEDIPIYMYEDEAYTKRDGTTLYNYQNGLTDTYHEVNTPVSSQSSATSNRETPTLVNDLLTAVNDKTLGTSNRETSTFDNDLSTVVNSQTLDTSNRETSKFDNNISVAINDQISATFNQEPVSSAINKEKIPNYVYEDEIYTKRDATTSSNQENVSTSTHLEEISTNSYGEVDVTVTSQTSTTSNRETSTFDNNEYVAVSDQTSATLNKEPVSSTIYKEEIPIYIYETEAHKKRDASTLSYIENVLTSTHSEETSTYTYDEVDKTVSSQTSATFNRETSTFVHDLSTADNSQTLVTSNSETLTFDNNISMVVNDHISATLNQESVSSAINKEEIPTYVYEDEANTKSDATTSSNKENVPTSNVKETSAYTYDEVSSQTSATSNGDTSTFVNNDLSTAVNDQTLGTLNRETLTFSNDLSTVVDTQTLVTSNTETSTFDNNVSDGVSDSTTTTLIKESVSITINKERIPNYIYEGEAYSKREETKTSLNKENASITINIEGISTYDYNEVATTVRSQTSATFNKETSTFVNDLSTAVNDQTSVSLNRETPTYVNIVYTTESSIATKDQEVSPELSFDCTNRPTGRYADDKDCQKFYICSGISKSIFGMCPANTVFSNRTKRCTKNLSLCVRMNQFKCVSPGRYIDYKTKNIYYICIKSGKSFRKFKFQCQKGYILDRQSVRCNLKEPEISNQSISNDNSQSSVEKKSQEGELKSKERKTDKKSKEKNHFACVEVGRFPFKYECQKYYECTQKRSSEKIHMRVKKCGKNKVFHRKKRKCVDNDDDSYECQ